MNNKRHSGICAYCDEESDRLFSPPLILPPNWDDVEQSRTEDSAWWHCPGQAYPGKDLYDIVIVDSVEYLKPCETPDESICWKCFNGHVLPAAIQYVVNKPIEIQFNGWLEPTWLCVSSI